MVERLNKNSILLFPSFLSLYFYETYFYVYSRHRGRTSIMRLAVLCGCSRFYQLQRIEHKPLNLWSILYKNKNPVVVGIVSSIHLYLPYSSEKFDSTTTEIHDKINNVQRINAVSTRTWLCCCRQTNTFSI